ncbi:MAG TPA: hypothetical protein VK783_16480 [Bacteroidia bacterium]|jgi:hypothetical protein|nr:hypothetical protein [Bacteroidia bacterium]
MLYLSIPTQVELDNYYESIIKKIDRVIHGIVHSAEIKAFLTSDRIKGVIQDEPAALLNHHKEAMMSLVANFNNAEYDTYIAVRNKQIKNAAESFLINRYGIVEQLFSVFNYAGFISGSKSTAYKLAAKLNRNTCTYCNRLYTQTITTGGEGTGGNNDSERIIRPEFDHWFPKYKYPLLALSYYNLIPSCSVCNTSVKIRADFTLDTHTHPYIKEAGQEFTFSYHNESVHENNVRIKVQKPSKTATTLMDFRTEKIYNVHSNLELKDLLELKCNYSKNYLEILLKKTFDSLEISEKEAYRLIFGVQKDEDDFHKRPLSKFKTDIIAELMEIDKKATLLNG